MVILVGLAFFAFALYAWLVGHWFGRVMAFVVLSILLGFAAFVLVAGQFHPHEGGELLGLLAAAGAVGVSWFLSGVPMAHWQAKTRELAVAERRSAPVRGSTTYAARIP